MQTDLDSPTLEFAGPSLPFAALSGVLVSDSSTHYAYYSFYHYTDVNECVSSPVESMKSVTTFAVVMDAAARPDFSTLMEFVSQTPVIVHPARIWDPVNFSLHLLTDFTTDVTVWVVTPVSTVTDVSLSPGI